MELTDNRYITETSGRLLEADGWTMETLATATQKQLSGYRGIGLLTASNIIREAGQMVNRAKLQESQILERGPMPTVDYEALSRRPPPEEMSVRVRRIWEQQQ